MCSSRGDAAVVAMRETNPLPDCLLELDVPAAPGRLGARKISAIVAAARLLSLQSRGDDEPSRLDEILLFGGAGRKATLDVGEPLARGPQAGSGTHHPRVVPHDFARHIGCDLGGATV